MRYEVCSISGKGMSVCLRYRILNWMSLLACNSCPALYAVKSNGKFLVHDLSFSTAQTIRVWVPL